MIGPHDVRGEEMLLGGVAASEIADRFGTPVYVYDAGIIEERYDRLREALPERTEICYAVKANPSLAVCTLLARRGAGAEVASRGELLVSRAAGFEARSTVMAGPAKSDEDHALALDMAIRSIHIEGPGEMERLEEAARRRGRSAPVPCGLRVNTLAALEEEKSIIGGAGPRKFGVDEERLLPVLEKARGSEMLRLCGVHVFNASNVRSAGQLVDNAARILDLAATIAAELDHPLEYVDIGGGFGVPYAAGEEPLDVEALGRGLAGLLKRGEHDALSTVRLIVEPGRFLVAEAGVYLCRVLEVKTSRGRNYALVDGGIHHLLRPVLIGARHPIVLAGRPLARPGDVFDVAGPLCTGLDTLGRDVPLPDPRPGDLVAVLCAGAYGFTESMTGFLSHPTPAEVLVRQGDSAEIRPRGDPREAIDRQRVPDFA